MNPVVLVALMVISFLLGAYYAWWVIGDTVPAWVNDRVIEDLQFRKNDLAKAKSDLEEAKSALLRLRDERDALRKNTVAMRMSLDATVGASKSSARYWADCCGKMRDEVMQVGAQSAALRRDWNRREAESQREINLHRREAESLRGQLVEAISERVNALGVIARVRQLIERANDGSEEIEPAANVASTF